MDLNKLIEQLEGRGLEEQFNIIAGLNIPENKFYEVIDLLFAADRDAYFKAYKRFGEKCVDPEFRFVVKSLIESGYAGERRCTEAIQLNWVVS